MALHRSKRKRHASAVTLACRQRNYAGEDVRTRAMHVVSISGYFRYNELPESFLFLPERFVFQRPIMYISYPFGHTSDDRVHYVERGRERKAGTRRPHRCMILSEDLSV
jgi:hypothetical protein